MRLNRRKALMGYEVKDSPETGSYKSYEESCECDQEVAVPLCHRKSGTKDRPTGPVGPYSKIDLVVHVGGAWEARPKIFD